MDGRYLRRQFPNEFADFHETTPKSTVLLLDTLPSSTNLLG
jgi:hypothetical protein